MEHLLLAAFDGNYYIVDAKKRLIYTVNKSAYTEISEYLQLSDTDRPDQQLSTAAYKIIGVAP